MLWAHRRLFWTDELLEFYTDTKPSAREVIAGQLHAPFSLEPPGFHLLLHFVDRLLPSHVVVVARMPSLFALLVTECCVYFLTLRLTRSQLSSAVAMLLPFFLVTADYAVEARAYSALTACMAMAMLFWTVACAGGRWRGLALCGMAGALILAITMHFFGIFLLVPLWVGELFRTWQRRRPDRGVLLALGLASLAVALDLPFERALAPFRQHYYNTGDTLWVNISFTYLWFYRHFDAYTISLGEVLEGEILAGCFVAVLTGTALWRIRQRLRRADPLAAVEVGLLTAALLPVFLLVVAQYARAYVPRYSLPAVVGLSVLTAVMVQEFFVVRGTQVALAGLLTYGAVRYALTTSVSAFDSGRALLAGRSLTAEQAAELHRLPDQHVYFQDVAKYLFFRFYAVPETRDALRGVYSQACELHWAGRDPSSLFARNLQRTGTLPFDSYAALRRVPGPHLLVVFHDPNEEWIERELGGAQVEVRRLGKAFGGDLLKVTLAAEPTCDRGEEKEPSATGAQ